MALGISEKGGAKIVQKFETDILGFLELSNWGRSGVGSHAELSEESFRKQLTLIKVAVTLLQLLTVLREFLKRTYEGFGMPIIILHI